MSRSQHEAVRKLIGEAQKRWWRCHDRMRKLEQSVAVATKQEGEHWKALCNLRAELDGLIAAQPIPQPATYLPLL